MDAKSLKTLKTGDKIKFAKGTVNYGLEVTFLRTIKTEVPCDKLRIEFEWHGQPKSLPHDRFTKV